MLGPIEPGTILNRIDVHAGKLRPYDGEVEVSLPARVHLSVLDMTRFSPGRPGGGGIGMAVDMSVNVRLRLQGSGVEVHSNREAIVEHISRVVSDFAGYQGGVEVWAEDHGINHLGLGSSSAIMSATAYALDLALGNPLDLGDLRKIIGYNFVEEGEGGTVVPGYETGVGPAAGYYGGFVVLSDRLELLARFPVEGERAMVIIPGCSTEGSLLNSNNAGEEEHRLLSTIARENDARDAGEKAREVLLDLIPAGLDGDMTRVGESVWRLQRLGSKVAEIEHHSGGSEIYALMGALREGGASIVGMSSVGPSIVALASGERYARVKDALASFDTQRVIETGVNNNGASWKKL